LHKTNKEIAFLILAAGKGTRMKNEVPKVLHKIAGKSLIRRVLSVTKKFDTKILITILAPEMKKIAELVKKNYPKTKIIYQEQQLGTGHAVKICLDPLKNFDGVVVTLYGDTPFITAHTIRKLAGSIDNKTAICVLGFECEKENAYGRLVLDNKKNLKKIVEVKEANLAQKKITLCNSGVMAFNGKYLQKIINKIDNNNSKGEFYLTDAIKIANNEGLLTKVVVTGNNEVIGINSQEELAIAEKIMQEKLRKKHLENGVIMTDPQTVYFSQSTKIAPGVTIEPFVVFKGKVEIGKSCHIYSFSHIEDCKISARSKIGPYARIRPGTEIGEDVRIGNFVEIKKSKIGNDSKIGHLSYIGDSELATDVNIGAGTVTCNYDGVSKHKTIIGDGAFIGSNSSLIAPVKIGKGAYIGAGTTLLKDAPAKKITVNDKKQRTINIKD